jgi:hypothetical protein
VCFSCCIDDAVALQSDTTKFWPKLRRRQRVDSVANWHSFLFGFVAFWLCHSVVTSPIDLSHYRSLIRRMMFAFSVWGLLAAALGGDSSPYVLPEQGSPEQCLSKSLLQKGKSSQQLQVEGLVGNSSNSSLVKDIIDQVGKLSTWYSHEGHCFPRYLRVSSARGVLTRSYFSINRFLINSFRIRFVAATLSPSTV